MTTSADDQVDLGDDFLELSSPDPADGHSSNSQIESKCRRSRNNSRNTDGVGIGGLSCVFITAGKY